MPPAEQQTPIPLKRRIELAEAALEVAASEARAASKEAARGSFDAAKRHAKLHSQIDRVLNELDWLKALDATFGKEPA